MPLFTNLIFSYLADRNSAFQSETSETRSSDNQNRNSSLGNKFELVRNYTNNSKILPNLSGELSEVLEEKESFYENLKNF